VNLYLISQRVNNGYDTYSDAVVAAKSEEEAKLIHPSGREGEERYHEDWAGPEHVQVQLLGRAVAGTVQGVICASFHAG
jgi:hypothetical protein